MPRKPLKVCFVTGTRAEFGLMDSVLQAIRDHPGLKLQLVVTGMHLHARYGRSINAIERSGWKIDAVVPWKVADDPAEQARQTGLAMARLADVFRRLDSDVVLIVGDRVEAFAAAAAAHICQKLLAHVHGGDRAPGQIDDSLRHAITKLAHLHFAATPQSEKRLLKLGEDRFRIYRVGSPGIDGITRQANDDVLQTFPRLHQRRYALLVLHPVDPSEKLEQARANSVLSAVVQAGFRQIVVIYPNNDPGAGGIIRCWQKRSRQITYLLKNLPRADFLGLLKHAAVLVGNSSSGIIEAASFGTPVVNVGPRQLGRDRSQNVVDVPYRKTSIARVLRKLRLQRRRPRCMNVYGGQETGRKIASILAEIGSAKPLIRKLITY